MSTIWDEKKATKLPTPEYSKYNKSQTQNQWHMTSLHNMMDLDQLICEKETAQNACYE